MPEQELSDRKLGQKAHAPKSGNAFLPGSLDAVNAGQAIQRVYDPRASIDSTSMLALQRTVGNQAVLRMLDQRQAFSGKPVNTDKQTISPIMSRHGTPRVMRSAQAVPQPSIAARTPKKLIQRASNWEDFKSYTKDEWGKGGNFRNRNEQAANFADPRQHYAKHANKGGKWNKFKGVMSGLGHGAAGLLAPAVAIGSTLLSGVKTMGAAAYYGAKGIGSGMSSLGSSAKAAYNKDRNPHGYDRNRLPTSGNATMQMGKPLGAMGLSAGAGGAIAAPVNLGSGTSGGVGMLNVLSAADSAMTWRRGSKEREQAKQRGDLAGEKVGTRTANQGKWGVAGGLAGMGAGGANLGAAVQHGASGLMGFNNLASGANYVSSGLGVAGAAAGIVGGSITAGQGLWKSGKAISKLWKLSKSAPMLTPDGERWKAHMKTKQKTKLGFNSLKVIGGALGIAAGALIIASNPVGWALGIASAATVGGLMAYKLWNKYKKSKRKQKAKAGVREHLLQEQEAARNLEDVENDNEGGAQGQDEAGMQGADPSKLDKAKRKQAVELGNRVAQETSKSGKIAGEIRSALGPRHDPMYAALIDSLEHKIPDHAYFRAHYKDPGCPVPTYALRVHDAVVLLNTLNVTPEQAEAESGQELIEKKLSVSDSL